MEKKLRSFVSSLNWRISKCHHNDTELDALEFELFKNVRPDAECSGAMKLINRLRREIVADDVLIEKRELMQVSTMNSSTFEAFPLYSHKSVSLNFSFFGFSKEQRKVGKRWKNTDVHWNRCIHFQLRFFGLSASSKAKRAWPACKSCESKTAPVVSHNYLLTTTE